MLVMGGNWKPRAGIKAAVRTRSLVALGFLDGSIFDWRQAFRSRSIVKQ
jgi:hypothetical protein